MIHKKHPVSQRQSKSSGHRGHYQSKLIYPIRQTFSIHHNQSNDSYSPQHFILSSKLKQVNINTAFSLKNSPKNLMSKFKTKVQHQQLVQKNFDWLPLRTISYQEIQGKNIEEEKTKRQSTRNELFSRQNIQQNNKKLNLLRKQNKKQISSTKTIEQTSLSKQKQRAKTKNVFKNSSGTSPIFKITSSNNSKYYRNTKETQSAERRSRQKITQIDNFMKEQNPEKNQIKFKPKQKKQNNQLFTENYNEFMNQQNEFASQQFIISKVFAQNEVNQNEDVLKPTKVHVHVKEHPIKINVHKKTDQKNRKSVPLFLGIYKEQKKQLTNQTQVQFPNQSDLNINSQKTFKPKLKVKKMDDNMNVLANILRKKSNIMSKKQLIEYLHKIIS